MREVVLKDGNDLRVIAKVILEPLVRHKPEGAGLIGYLEKAFGTDVCTILRYRVKEAFRMPGCLHLTANVKRQGMGKRNVREGAELFVRDNSTTGFVDVEVTGKGRRSQWFSMEALVWGQIVLPNVKVIGTPGPRPKWEKQIK